VGRATRPQSRLYFGDACRNQPGLFAKYQARGGIAPPQLAGEDRRAAPVYFSASPDTAALGLGGRGTLFAEALQEGLRGPAAEDGADPEGRWYVSTYSLGKALQSRVAGLAAALRDAQTAVLGGQVAP